MFISILLGLNLIKFEINIICIAFKKRFSNYLQREISSIWNKKSLTAIFSMNWFLLFSALFYMWIKRNFHKKLVFRAQTNKILAIFFYWINYHKKAQKCLCNLNIKGVRFEPRIFLYIKLRSNLTALVMILVCPATYTFNKAKFSSR